MRRSGTVAINRLEHAHDGENAKGTHQGHPHHMSIDERMAKTLSRTKTSGIVGTRTIAGIAAFKKANLLDDPESVVHQSLAVQAEFRLKITCLFLAQMTLMFAVMMVCLYTPAINNVILSFEPVHALVCLLIVPVLLAVIFCIKYKPPYSQIAMIGWTVYTGFVAAVCQHKVINDNGMYQIFCCGLGGFLVTTILGQMKVGKGADKRLFSSVGAGAIGSIVTIVVSATLQSQNVWGGSWGVWLCATGIAITTVMWISYDTELLAHKMCKEEWTQCIVFFMTDLGLLFLFCCLICCCLCMGQDCGEGGGDAAAGGGAEAAAGAGDVGNLA
jgi:FtsH-binding integral membrane protein